MVGSSLPSEMLQSDVCAWHKAEEISNKSVAAWRSGPGIAPPVYPGTCAWVRSFQWVGCGLSPIIRSAAIVTEGRSLNYESTDTLVTLSARAGFSRVQSRQSLPATGAADTPENSTVTTVMSSNWPKACAASAMRAAGWRLSSRVRPKPKSSPGADLD